MHCHQQDQAKWWQRGVIYQIYPRSFKDSTGNGIGDLPGITGQLDYLRWLGVDAIWISPIYSSPMADFGYDVADYTDIDPLFGSLADFDELLARAHGYGLKVILDFVPNHTSNQHPWFTQSRSSRMNPKRDWYLWRDAKPDGSPPTNWLSVFGGSAWTWDEPTGQYYLHSFLPEQPDLNWRNPHVRAAMFDVLRFWLNRGVDGFRVDVIDFLLKDDQFRDEPLNPGYMAGKDNPSNALLHLYSRHQPGVHEVIRDLRRVLDEYGDRIGIGEISSRLSFSALAAFYGDGDELHLPFNFKLIHLPWQASAIRQFVDAYEAALPAGAWPNYVLGNHDQPRLVSRIGIERARVGAMLLLTLRGTPFIYYGDEIGMHDVEILPHQVKDPFEVRTPGQGRDPQRTPMQWSAESYAGFSIAEPWLPVAADYSTVNVAAQRDDPTSMLRLYQRLIQYRKVTPALNRGSYHPLGDTAGDCFVYLRQFDDQRRLIALNFSTDEQTLTLPDLGDGRIVISTYLDREETVDLTSLYLRGYEGCIIELVR